MFKILFLFLLLISFNKGFTQVNTLWNKTLNGSGSGIDQVTDLQLDLSGNSFITGTSFNGTDFDILTIKYDADGTLLWSHTYGGTGLDQPSNLKIDSNGDVIVVGSKYISGTDWDISVVKINGNNGSQVWDYVHTGSAYFDLGNDLILDNSNNIYVAGSYYLTSTNLDYILIKLDINGNNIWNHIGGGTATDEGLLVDIDASGNTYLVGTTEFSVSTTYFDIFTVKIDASGNAVWTDYQDSGFGKLDKPNALLLDPLGNIYIGGSAFTDVNNLEDYFLFKLNNSGIFQWNKIHSGNGQGTDEINAIATDASGTNIYVTGKVKSLSSAEDFYTVAYSNSGTELWNKTYTSTGLEIDVANDIQFSNNNIYVTGYSYLSAENNNYLTLKYDINGNTKWEISYNNSNSNDQAKSLRIDSQDNIIVTGTSYENSAENLNYKTLKYCQLETIATNDTSICIGDSINLIANAPGGFNYSWQSISGTTILPGNFSCTTCNTAYATPTETTTYIVSAENAIGCVDYDTVVITVNVPSIPQITTSGSTTFCPGDSVILSINNENYTNYSWDIGATDSIITISSPTLVTITITDSNGCINNNDTTTFNHLLPVIDAGLNHSICFGQTSQLSATGGISYLWNSNPDLSQYIIQNPIASPSANSSYYVTGTDINGCTNYDSISVSIYSLPIVTTSGDDQICVGDSIQLSANGANTYLWDNSSSLSNNSISNPKASPSIITTYSVVGTDINGCEGIGNLSISVNSIPFISAGIDQTICQNDSVHIYATGGAMYSWETSTDLSNLSISNPWASPFISTDFIVLGTDANNCSNTDTVSVFVNAIPNVNAGNDTSICLNDAISLNSSGAISYLWNPHPSLSGINLNNPVVNPIVNTSYIIEGTNINGCSNTDTVEVSIFALPLIDAGTDQFICLGDSIQLMPTGGISYFWDLDISLSDPSLAQPYASPSTPTAYLVNGTDANGCTNTDQILISINQLPLTYAGNDINFCLNDSAQLQASGSTSFQWNANPSLNNLNVFNPWVIGLQNSSYFYVTGTDNNNCSATDSVYVTINQPPAQPTISESHPYLISSYVFGNQWYFNGSLLSPEVNDSLNYFDLNVLGGYSVTHTDFNGCTSSISNEFDITILEDTSNIGLIDFILELNPIKLYPNPTNNGIFIETTENIDGFNIYDAQGRVIFNQVNIEKGTSYFDLENITPGMYFITFYKGEQIKTMRLVRI